MTYEPEPSKEEIKNLTGPVVLEFGTDWCGYCQAAQPLVTSAFLDSPEVRHLKIADGSGHPLGRSFRVKLWPTLIFLRDGKEMARTVRPTSIEEIRRGIEAIASPS